MTTSLRHGFFVLTGLLAVNLGCFVAVTALDAFGGVAPQFSLPLIVMALLLCLAWLLSARRAQPCAAVAQEESAAAQAATRATVKPFLRRSQPAAASFRSALMISRRPDARSSQPQAKEARYETLRKAA